MNKQLDFLGIDNRFEILTKLGDNLEKLKIIDWEIFRETIEKGIKNESKKVAGRPAYDYVFLFKILVIQRLFNTSDDQTEYLINDRISFMRFLDINLSDKIPDAKTIWLFREKLTKAKIIEELFYLFTYTLDTEGIISHTGTIVDATFVDAPKQRNKKEENDIIKNGGIPEKWEENTLQAKHKKAQKDVDARWTKKGNQTYYGYKNHAKVDADSKIITDYNVTTASVHDSNVFLEFIDETDKVVYADSAYRSKEISEQLPKTVKNEIHEKGYKNNPLTIEQKENNNRKSKVRVRVEHVFGFMTNSMNGISLRTIGIERAKFNVGITNLIYNIFRSIFLKSRDITRG